MQKHPLPGSEGGTPGELAEEIASLRLVLRRTLGLAAEEANIRESIRLTDIYGVACVRLVKLLRVVGLNQEGLVAWFDGLVDQALRDVAEEMGLRI